MLQDEQLNLHCLIKCFRAAVDLKTKFAFSEFFANSKFVSHQTMSEECGKMQIKT